jgi:uncharacterized Zn finger protein (UPF0148 family)
MKKDTKINCPNCGDSIDVQDILAHQLEDEIKQKYQAEIASEKKKYEAEQDKLKSYNMCILSPLPSCDATARLNFTTVSLSTLHNPLNSSYVHIQTPSN